MPTIVNYKKGDKFLRVLFNLSATADDMSLKILRDAQEDVALARKVEATFSALLEERIVRIIKDTPEPEYKPVAEGRNVIALQFQLPDKWRGEVNDDVYKKIARHPKLLARVEGLVREKIEAERGNPQPV